MVGGGCGGLVVVDCLPALLLLLVTALEIGYKGTWKAGNLQQRKNQYRRNFTEGALWAITHLSETAAVVETPNGILFIMTGYRRKVVVEVDVMCERMQSGGRSSLGGRGKLQP